MSVNSGSLDKTSNPKADLSGIDFTVSNTCGEADHVKILRILLVLPLALSLGGCDWAIISPAGDVAVQQRNLIFASTALMLLIIVPVIAATLIFAWRYRASNTGAVYDPHWHHSTHLEVLIWTAPLLIIIALGALTWISTHVLDPFRSIHRIDAARPVASEIKPLTIEAVALDWKWLFFYPDQGIATVNELAMPIDQPVNFKITSATVMNSFFVPSLAGQIYAMAGMETRLHTVLNKAGDTTGFSAQYSGAGFSHMNFPVHGLSPKDFEAWVGKAKSEGKALDRAHYLELAKPSENNAAERFATVDGGLYDAILNLCAQPGKMCMNEMMHVDASGGGGKDSDGNYERLKYDGALTKEGNEAPGATFPASGRPPNTLSTQPQGMKPRTVAPEVHQPGGTQPDQNGGGAMKDMPGMTMPDHSSPAPAQLNQN